jgi:hypothetical protein
VLMGPPEVLPAMPIQYNTASNGRMKNERWTECERKLPGRTEENNENLNQDSRCAGRDSNQALPEHKSEPSPSELACSVSVVIKQLCSTDLINCNYLRFI